MTTASDPRDDATQIQDGQSNDSHGIESAKGAAPPLTADALREGVSAAISRFKGQVFKSLQAAGTESLLIHLIAVNVRPLIEAHLSASATTAGLVRQIWRTEYAIFERYLATGQFELGKLSASVDALLATDPTSPSIFETLLVFTDTLFKLQEEFRQQEWVLQGLRDELRMRQRQGQFQRLQITLPTEQLSQPVTSRGDLQIQVSASKPTIVAGEEFSIFVVIGNPFEVPIVLYSVESQIPVELVDRVEKQRRSARALNELLRARELIRTEESAAALGKPRPVPFHVLSLIKESMQLAMARRRIRMRLEAEPESRIAQAVAPSELSEQQNRRVEISVRQEVGRMEGGGTVIGTQIQPIDITIESASPKHLDQLLWRLESFRRGVTPIVLQPGDSVVKQFVFKTKHWLFFTPLAHTMQIQVRYVADDRDHLDTVPFALTIQAAIVATMVGAIIGSTIGAGVRLIGEVQEGTFNPVSQLLSVLLAVVLSAITVVSFARKSGVQQIVSIEDFWGGLFLGFLVGFLGQSFALNLITPAQPGA